MKMQKGVSANTDGRPATAPQPFTRYFQPESWTANTQQGERNESHGFIAEFYSGNDAARSS